MQQFDHDVYASDLLDCMAILGLKLSMDPDGESSEAYMEQIAEDFQIKQ